MRIYNRDQSAILSARNNRLAKMRAFSSSTKTRASSKGTTQSAPKSKNYRTSAWMQFLNQFQNGTAVSGDKIVENQKKSYDYEITGLAAERVETHMKRFLEEGEKSLYQEGEDAGKQLTKEMESFVSDYNMMIRKIGGQCGRDVCKEAENGDLRAGDRPETDRNHAGEGRHAVV